ncbi:unnamed protein product [Tetraodon nigroviridis]|uniref:(spotted green pufferfish) hypothetical protein n=1 Tax=Tetraodon nigroviridis TaxID=99883 RepID=Q4SDK2_TETNG|nr:unnamed protein product [Tetraodon nigroviridis]
MLCTLWVVVQALAVAVEAGALNLQEQVAQGATGDMVTLLAVVPQGGAGRGPQAALLQPEQARPLAAPARPAAGKLRLQDTMEFQTVILLLCLFKTSFTLPLVLQPPEMLLNWNPQLAAPFNPQFFPNQASQLTPVLPPNGPELQPQEPNAANGPQLPLNPVQSFGYFVPPYGYPQQRNPAVLPPNGPPVGRATQRPQLPLQVRYQKTVGALFWSCRTSLQNQPGQNHSYLHFCTSALFFSVAFFLHSYYSKTGDTRSPVQMFYGVKIGPRENCFPSNFKWF